MQIYLQTQKWSVMIIVAIALIRIRISNLVNMGVPREHEILPLCKKTEIAGTKT